MTQFAKDIALNVYLIGGSL